jgi:AraC-like DNA-binding protein
MEPLAWRAPAAQPDAVSTLLEELRWTVTGYARHELAPGSGQSFHGAGTRFHHVVSGEATIQDPGGTVHLRPDDVLLTLRGGDYTVRAQAPTVLLSATMDLVGGVHQVAGRLPVYLLSCGFAGQEPLVAMLLERMEAELAGSRSGAPSVVSHLANVVASTALRAWVEGGCDVEGWHRAAADPDIARAAAAIRDDPARAWTVARLATVAHASRSSFAERFHLVVGEPPGRYVARIRMERAKELLGRNGLSVAQAATRLGYGSEAAFSRAFRRVVGLPPGTWRQRRTEPSTASTAAEGGQPDPTRGGSDSAHHQSRSHAGRVDQ